MRQTLYGIGRRLGLTARTAPLLALAVAALAVGARTGMAVFYAVACGLAFAAGTQWETACDCCGESLEER